MFKSKRATGIIVAALLVCLALPTLVLAAEPETNTRPVKPEFRFRHELRERWQANKDEDHAWLMTIVETYAPEKQTDFESAFNQLDSLREEQRTLAEELKGLVKEKGEEKRAQFKELMEEKRAEMNSFRDEILAKVEAGELTKEEASAMLRERMGNMKFKRNDLREDWRDKREDWRDRKEDVRDRAEDRREKVTELRRELAKAVENEDVAKVNSLLDEAYDMLLNHIEVVNQHIQFLQEKIAELK